MHHPALHALVRPALAAQVRALAPSAAVCGLDVSTRNVGFAVLRGDGALLRACVLPSDGDGAFPFALRVRAHVARAHAETPLVRVGVEDVMKSFSSGRFTSQGIYKLVRSNGILSFVCWDLLGGRRGGVPVEPHMPNAIRAYLGIRRGDAGGGAAEDARGAPPPPGVAIKLAVMRFVGAAYPALGAAWERTRTGSFKPHNYDLADAVATACFTLARHHEQLLLRQPAFFAAACAALAAPHAAGASGRRAGGPLAAATAEELALLAELHQRRMRAEEREERLGCGPRGEEDEEGEEGEALWGAGGEAARGPRAAAAAAAVALQTGDSDDDAPVSAAAVAAAMDDGQQPQPQRPGGGDSVRRAPLKRRRSAADKLADAALQSDALVALYGRVRRALSEAVREALLGDSEGGALLWPHAAAAVAAPVGLITS